MKLLSPALRFLSSQVWAIHPPIFDSLSALLEDRANGHRPAAFDDGSVDSAPASEPSPTIVGNTAIMPVRGVLARYADQINGACQDAGRSAESMQRDLQALASDPRIERIILRIDSPGGTVAGTAETGQVIRDISANGKPVIAFVDGMAASAGYWLASQCDEIVMAGPTTEVGSIGVITAHVDSTRAQESRGFKVQVFRTSPLKAPGAMGESLTREQALSIDRDMADFHQVFASTVQAGRGLTDEQLAAATTGEMWRPDAAIAMGLADRVASLDDLLGQAMPTPQAAAPTQPNPPAAAGTEKESNMDTKTQAALTALSEAHPTLASALVKEAIKPDATPEKLDAIVRKSVDANKDAEIAELKAKLTQRDADAAKATADAAAATEAAAKAKNFAANVPTDPGAGEATVQVIPIARSASLTKAEWKAMQAGKAKFG